MSQVLIVPAKDRRLFQSLFSWKYNCEENIVSRSLTYGGFNPCFHGSTTVRTSAITSNPAALMFQSLFSWKYNCEPVDIINSFLNVDCFNPCFHGSTTVSTRFMPKAD
ncbi:Uncharacterized protein dnl_30450 [Desulfonema limicola]|uniref:Uncharacterized protein n=1 Tax=Desulfonema limicola TaxID=45656 RepID=A0A975B8R5_9BACT|nr:Uncharacterized protein dnl_30450 [Desulfonema limicola]